MYRDIAHFVSALESQRELLRVRDRVSPVLEIPEIVDRVSKSVAPNAASERTRANDRAFCDLGGPALLFENVEGSDFPVLINAYGSYRRMEIALGARDGLDAIADRMAELVKPQPPRSFGEAMQMAKRFAPLLRIGPRRLKGFGPCQEVIDRRGSVDLTRLPMLRCWPHDGDFASLGYPPTVNADVEGRGHPDIERDEWDRSYRGRYITLAGIHTIHADDRHDPRPASHNIGMYRVQLLGRDRLAMHWHMHHDGAAHWRSWKKLGEPMPVAIALGGESVLPYAATAPLPPGISELLMAGFLNGRGIDMVRALTVPLWVPANAEFIIEGFVDTDGGFPGYDPREPDSGRLGEGAVFEGPFGDHTGFYSLPDRYPIVRVTAVTRRANAVFPATIVGLPPQEDYYLGKTTERLFLPLLKVLIPDIIDYDLPMFGAFHNCAFVKIRKHYPLQARRVMHAIWGAGQMAWTKTVFVVDDDVDVHDVRAVLDACARWCRPSRDIETANGALDILDHAAPRLAAGVKMGFDCTRKIAGEEVGGIEIDEGPRWEMTAVDGSAAWLSRVNEVSGVLSAACPAGVPGLAIVRVNRVFDEPASAGVGRRVAEAAAGLDPDGGPPFVIVVGRDVDPEDPVAPLFHWLANADMGRDAVRIGDTIAFDATPKTPEDGGEHGPVRPWPPLIRMDEDVRRSVAERLATLGPPGVGNPAPNAPRWIAPENVGA
ncbi:MAG: hypothetical protein CMJ31_01935 [Phycisphaerae bacterium]|nr:hypothetical protein [Phycisphaerae bacterium]